MQEKPNGRLRVAFISRYNVPCGIATYNQELIAQLRHYADVKVFAEYADSERAPRVEGDPEFVIRCWDSKEHPKITLVQEINDFCPNVCHFSHEYGLFPSAVSWVQLISWLRGLGYPVVATMHSVYDHQDKTVHESAVPNIIVHTEQAKITMAKRGIDPDQVTVIPHGTNIFAGTKDNPDLLPELWNTWGSEHTIFQPGFLFSYKGHKRMLEVVARLKEKYNDVHYIIQASENPRNQKEHDRLYGELFAEIGRLGLEGSVTISRGFISQEALLAHIRTTKCVVLPYANHPEHDVRATSGIARLVLATETPLVTSHVHLFDDIEGLCPRVSDDEELYNAIDKIFYDWKERAGQIEKRRAFLKKTSWGSVAHRLSSYYREVIGK